MPRHAGPGRGRHRARWTGAAVAAVAISGVALSACSNDGLTLARQACTHVDRSLTDYTKAQHASSSQVASADAKEAFRQLEAALPLAAAATSADPRWNPLMTTLQEIGRTSEANLTEALQAQCASAAHPTPNGPVAPTTTPTPVTTTTRPSH